MKPAIVVLAVACLGLSVALIVVKQQADARVKASQAHGPRSMVEWDELKTRFTDLEKLCAFQQGALDRRSEELTLASNALARANAELAKTTADLNTRQREILKNQERITAFEKEREELTKKMDELTPSIHKLELQIADANKKLASAEGDKSFLLAEVKRLQGEKDVLVRQFNDLATLRVQVARLREEAAIKQRLEWKRMGVYAMQEQKGAERLMARTFIPTGPDNRLDVEIHQNGARRLVPASTKAPSDGAGP